MTGTAGLKAVDTDVSAQNSVKINLRPVFATPFAIGRFEGSLELAGELAGIVRRRKAEEEGVSKSNVGGWHSSGDMNQWGGEPARTLSKAAVRMARKLSFFDGGSVDDYEWRCNMWANVSAKGHSNVQHVHPGVLWAAVFYLDLGRSEGGPDDVGGELVMEDPRFPLAQMKIPKFQMVDANGKPVSSSMRFRPSLGDLIVFPAWLRHAVTAYTGDRERISLAMNIDAVERPGRSPMAPTLVGQPVHVAASDGSASDTLAAETSP